MTFDWTVYGFIVLGVLISAILPAAVTALWPQPASRGPKETAEDVFLRLWPGGRMVAAALVVGVAAFAASAALGQEISAWWQAVLVGIGSDRIVAILSQVLTR
jgi:hypothetical protein